ncbi:MAG: TetR/AcrR family transcriptional regulator [Solirubrobacteraceae bacterium]|nr:TetR/AcrR family transcriptional regulator [Solirubrobacteraceae bacterium]
MSRRDGRSRRQKRRDEVRDAMLPVIEDLLASGTAYSDISVQTLLDAMPISRSTFYAYFTDKTDLLRACAEAVFEQTAESARAWWDLGPDVHRDELHEALDRTMREYLHNGPLMAAIYDGARYDPGLRDAVNDIMDRHQGLVEAHIVRGQAGGWVDPTLPAAETARWLPWAFERTLHQVLARPIDEDELTASIAAGTLLLWRVLYEPTLVGA